MERTTVHVDVYSDLSEQPGAEPFYFAVENVKYRIDLTSDEREAFLEALGPYLAVARTDVRRRVQNRLGSKENVRAWAQENGFQVAAKGAIPRRVQEAYDAAHPGQADRGDEE